METIEQLQKEIQILKDAMKDTNSEFVNSAYAEEIEQLEELILTLMDKEEIDEYPEGDNFIDMSGASDNGDR